MPTPRVTTPRPHPFAWRFTAADVEGLAALLDPANLYRFESHVLVADADQCWLWTGTKHATGYGLVKIQFAPGKKHLARASRVALALALGAVPENAWASPSCGNRACVNLAHLVPSLPVEIAQRLIREGRHFSVPGSLRTTCPAGHGYHGDNLVREENGRHRRCRTCRNAIKRESWPLRRERVNAARRRRTQEITAA